MIGWILLGLLLIIIIRTDLYLFELHKPVKIEGEIFRFPLVQLHNEGRWFCWLAGIDFSNGEVSPVYCSLFKFYIGTGGVAIETCLGTTRALMIAFKFGWPFIIVKYAGNIDDIEAI